MAPRQCRVQPRMLPGHCLADRTLRVSYLVIKWIHWLDGAACLIFPSQDAFLLSSVGHFSSLHPPTPLEGDNCCLGWIPRKQSLRLRADAYCFVRKSDPREQVGGRDRSEAGKEAELKQRCVTHLAASRCAWMNALSPGWGYPSRRHIKCTSGQLDQGE